MSKLIRIFEKNSLGPSLPYEKIAESKVEMEIKIFLMSVRPLRE